ncbi:hypothetical protein B4U80_11744, partial [Leptotrombidium deliense]
MKFDNKTLVPLKTYTPEEVTTIGIKAKEDVHTVISVGSKVYIETLTTSNEVYIYTYNTKSGLKSPVRSCAYGCIGESNLFDSAAVNEATTSRLIVGSVEFNTVTDNKQKTLIIIPSTKIDDPFDFKVERVQRYENGMRPLDSDTKPKGHFHTYAAIVVKTTSTANIYYTFHRYNWACLMKRHIGSESPIFDYEEQTANEILPQCQRTQEFLGCPQSFCYNHEIDDLTVGTIDGSKKVLLFRGAYYWLLTHKATIPLELPKVASAKLIGKDNKPYPKMNDFKYVDAAEVVYVNSEPVVLIFKNDKVLLVIKNETIVSSVTSIFKERNTNDIQVEAAWFSANEASLYLFSQNKFQVYTLTLKDKTLSATLKDKTEDIATSLKGMPSVVKAAISLENKLVHFMNGAFYYTALTANVQKRSTRMPEIITFNPSQKFFETTGDPCK